MQALRIRLALLALALTCVGAAWHVHHSPTHIRAIADTIGGGWGWFDGE
jgi:hypothetical protein